MIECHPIQPGEAGRQEWLTWRKPDITASVAGALLGCDMPGDTTPLKLYAEKRGTEFPPVVENKMMRRGRKLERTVGEEVAEARPEWQIEPVGAYYRNAELRLGATPDFWILGDPRGRGVLQAKTCNPNVLAKHWDQGRIPPEWIVWQLRTEMLMTDAAFGAIAALVVGDYEWDCHIIEVERDPHQELTLVTAVRKFWRQVADGIEPEPDFSKDADVIRARAGHETPGLRRDLSGNNELPELLSVRAAMQAQIKNYEARCDAIEAELKWLMGDAEQATGLNGWRITYKTTDRVAYTVPAKKMRVLRIYDKREESQI
jgi:predicted phage-related endonuclease